MKGFLLIINWIFFATNSQLSIFFLGIIEEFFFYSQHNAIEILKWEKEENLNKPLKIGKKCLVGVRKIQQKILNPICKQNTCFVSWDFFSRQSIVRWEIYKEEKHFSFRKLNFSIKIFDTQRLLSIDDIQYLFNEMKNLLILYFDFSSFFSRNGKKIQYKNLLKNKNYVEKIKTQVTKLWINLIYAISYEIYHMDPLIHRCIKRSIKYQFNY